MRRYAGLMIDEPKKENRPPISTVSGVLPDGTLVELVYSPKERRTRFAVGNALGFSIVDQFTAPEGERWVPLSAENNLIRHEVVLLPEQPEPYGTTDALVEEITIYLDRYVDLSPDFRLLAVYYILLTWVYDACNELPYLRLRGDFGTGKTRALTVIGSICYKAFFASGASTISPIFHILDTFRGTMILDEADFRFSDEKAELVKILNNGNARGFPVLRTMMNAKREFDPRAFNVYGPKLIGMRHSFDDEALESRFITENMGSRRVRDDIPRNLPNSQREEARALRNKLLTFRFSNRNELRIGAHDSTTASDRVSQIAAPILALATNSETRTQLLRLINGINDELRADRADLPEAALLEVLIDLIAESNQWAIPVKQIAARLIQKAGRDIDRPITARYVGQLLRKRLHLTTFKSHGNYVWPVAEREKLEVLAARYGIDTAGTLSPGSFPTASGGHRDVGDFASGAEDGSDEAEPQQTEAQ